MDRYEGKGLILSKKARLFQQRLVLVFSAPGWLNNALNIVVAAISCRWGLGYRRTPAWIHDDLQALYNVSDGSVYLKNSPFHPGNPADGIRFIIKSRTAPPRTP